MYITILDMGIENLRIFFYIDWCKEHIKYIKFNFLGINLVNLESAGVEF